MVRSARQSKWRSQEPLPSCFESAVHQIPGSRLQGERVRPNVWYSYRRSGEWVLWGDWATKTTTIMKLRGYMKFIILFTPGVPRPLS